VLLGFVQPTNGSASLFGIDVRQPIARQRIGYLPELTYYYKFLTAEELLRFYSRIFSLPRAEAEKRIDAVLKLVELESARKRLIKTYSKGMQQRVGLAQALINNPDLLILDEPTSGLDVLASRFMRDFVRTERARGKAVLFSTHYLAEAELLCDRIGFLHRGRLLVEGTPAAIRGQTEKSTLEEAFLALTEEPGSAP
jgi:ABC-2 type transport system ATP-binding protein